MTSAIISVNKIQPQNRNFMRWATTLIRSNTVLAKLVSVFYILLFRQERDYCLCWWQ